MSSIRQYFFATVCSSRFSPKEKGELKAKREAATEPTGVRLICLNSKSRLRARELLSFTRIYENFFYFF